jgi:hypothetical protein
LHLITVKRHNYVDDWTVGTLHNGIRSTGHGHLVTFELTGVLHSIDATVPADWA